jgi:hypothetical protein
MAPAFGCNSLAMCVVNWLHVKYRSVVHLSE